jgi:hypothetical protein
VTSAEITAEWRVSFLSGPLDGTVANLERIPTEVIQQGTTYVVWTKSAAEHSAVLAPETMIAALTRSLIEDDSTDAEVPPEDLG